MSDLSKTVVGKDYILDKLLKKYLLKYSINEIEEISDLLMEVLCNAFIEGKSIKYSENTPLFKAKVSLPNTNEGSSPKIARNVHVIVSAKFKLKE